MVISIVPETTKPELLQEGSQVKPPVKKPIDTLKDIFKKLGPDVVAGLYDPEQAVGLGINLEAGWKLKVAPSGKGRVVSLMTPEGWEIGEDFFISPYGKRVTEEQYKTIVAEGILDLPWDMIEPRLVETQVGPIKEKGYVRELPYLRTEEELISQLAGEMPVPERIKAEEELAWLQGQSATVLGDLISETELMEISEDYFPENRIEELEARLEAIPEKTGIEYFKTAEELATERSIVNRRFDEFLGEIQSMGRTTETEGILRAIFPEITPQQITQIFTPELSTEGTEPLPIEPMPDTWGGSVFSWVEEQIGRRLSFGETIGSKPIPELGNMKMTQALSTAIATGSNLPGEIPYTGVIDTARVFGQSLLRLPQQIAVAFLQATQGEGGASVVNKDWADKYIQEANEDFEKFVQDIAKEFPDAEFMKEVASVSQNLSFSLISMGSGLAAGIPIAAIPAPGARAAAYAIGTAASGFVAYQITTYQIMQQYLELLDEDKRARTGEGLTPEEENQAKADFSAKATQYGLWEAIPEALSNLAFIKLLAPLKNVVGKFAPAIIARLTGIYGEELITETITQKGQAAIEVSVGLREGNISWWEAFKEIAPQTFLLTTIMSGAGGVVIGTTNAVQRVKDSLKQEIGENNPLYPEFEQKIEAQLPEVVQEAPTLPTEIPIISKVEAPEAIELRALHTDPTRMEGLRNSTREDAIGYLNRLKTLAETEGTNKNITTINQAIREAQEGDLGTAGVMADEVLTNIHKRYKLSHPTFELARAVGAEAEVAEWERIEEAKGLREYLETEPLAAARFTLGGKQVGLESFISMREQSFPEYFTIKQARALMPEYTFTEYNQKGTPKYNKVPRDVALDDLTKKFNMTPDEIADRTIQIKAIKKRIKEFLFAEKGLLTIGKDEAPKPKGATKKVFDRIQVEAPEVGLKEKMSKGWHNFNVKMVDDLYALKKFTEGYTSGGVELSIDENPYMLARLLKGVNSKATAFLERGTFGKKFWRVEKGKAVPNYTGESLESVLKEVREPRQWQDFSTYLVARRSFDLWSRNIETGISEADALSAIEELETKYKNFPDLAKRVYKYQDNLLVYAQEMGLMSNDLLAKLRRYGNYVPFYRVFNELQAKGFMGKKMANIAQPIKRIKGSEREILNPLESIVKNTYVIITSADRNMVGISMTNLVDQNPELANYFERVKTPMAKVARVNARELGVDIEGLTKEDTEQIVDVFRPSFFTRGDEVTVLIDGKKAYFKIDSDLRDALLNLDRESIGILGKFLSYPAKWLRAGATLSPDFMVRNPARDQMTAFCYSNYGFLPGIDFMKGIASLIGKDADYQLYKMSGAEHSMMVSMDRLYLQKTFKEIVEGKKFTDYVKHPLELFQIISELGEKATRIGEFKRGIARGAVPLEAGYSSRAVSLDFSQAGTTAHALNRMIAFFNANIRGWGRMVSSFKEHPTRTAFRIFVGITLPSILLYYANRDDPRWEEIPQWQKDLFWIIFIGDTIVRIPKPFELGIIFGSVPERFLEWIDNRDPKLMKDTLVNLAEAGSPGFIPTAMLPILEIITNYSFFRGRAIVPASREKMPPELQYTGWTSEVSKKLGEWLGFSPAKIDNLINGWTGGLGRYATDILGAVLKGTGISPDIPEPSPTLADIPVLKAFIVRNPYGSSGEAVNNFYELLEDYEQGEKYLKEMLSLGEIDKFEEYKGAHPELLFFYDFENDIAYSASARYLRRVARDLSEIGNKQGEVYDSSDISSEEKRRLIDEMDILKTDVAQKALELFLGEVPEVLQSRINESINNLGEVIDPSFPLSVEKPDIFNMGDLNSEFNSILEGVTPEDLAKLEGIDPLAFAYLEKEKSEGLIDLLVSRAIYEIEPELAEGFTFEDYYKQWQSGLIEDTDLDSLTRRQRDLLRNYHSLTPIEQKDFLDKYPELKLNPRDEWLKNNPLENARLALWGRENIISLEAYNELKKLVEKLDIPESAIPDLGLPPNEAVDDWFSYLDKMGGYGKSASSARSSLHMSLSSINRDNLNIFYLDMEYSLLRDENGDADSRARRIFRSAHKEYNEYGVEQGWWKPLSGTTPTGVYPPSGATFDISELLE